MSRGQAQLALSACSALIDRQRLVTCEFLNRELEAETNIDISPEKSIGSWKVNLTAALKVAKIAPALAMVTLSSQEIDRLTAYDFAYVKDAGIVSSISAPRNNLPGLTCALLMRGI
jgi:hypothetical protein